MINFNTESLVNKLTNTIASLQRDKMVLEVQNEQLSQELAKYVNPETGEEIK